MQSLNSQAHASAERVQQMMLDQATAPDGIAPAFSPDGKLVVFGKRVDKGMFLFESEKIGGKWSAPHVASFSGQYTDIEPTFAPSGKYIIFASNRPLTKDGPLVDGNYDGQVRPGHGGQLWRVERSAAGWGEAQPLPQVINASSSTFSPSIAADDSLYFMRPVNAGEKFHLYRAKMEGAHYAEPERLSFSNLDAYGDFDPAVAKNGSFVIFSSPRPPALPRRSDLFIVYRKGNDWSSPVDLSSLLTDAVYGVEARLSPDGKTLYFTNGMRLASDPPESTEHPYVQHTWQVDISTLKAR